MTWASAAVWILGWTPPAVRWTVRPMETTSGRSSRVAHLHPDPTDFRRWLSDRLADGYQSDGGHGVQLATVHRVKGREWPHVIVYEASKGLNAPSPIGRPGRGAPGVSRGPHPMFRISHPHLRRPAHRLPSRTHHPLPPPHPNPSQMQRLASSPLPSSSDQPHRQPQPLLPNHLAALSPSPPPIPEGAAAYEALKAWRLQRSRADNVPRLHRVQQRHPHRTSHPPPHHRRRTPSRPRHRPRQTRRLRRGDQGILRSDTETSG